MSKHRLIQLNKNLSDNTFSISMKARINASEFDFKTMFISSHTSKMSTDVSKSSSSIIVFNEQIVSKTLFIRDVIKSEIRFKSCISKQFANRH